MMKKDKISVWWLVAAVLPLAACLMLRLAAPAAMSRGLGPLGAERFSAEIARTVSYGLIDGELVSSPRPIDGDAVRIVPARVRVERAQ
jgi:hypothetical protein